MTPATQPASLPSETTQVSPETAHHLAALLTHAAISPLTDTGWLRITGDDRVRWLNGMVTNSIQELNPGQGNYNFILSAQGRIQGDAFIFVEPAAANADASKTLLLETSAAQLPILSTLLDRFIIMDDVELSNISSTRAGLLIAGPVAAALLGALGLRTEDLSPLQLKISLWKSNEVTVLQAHSPLVPRFELWADPGTIAALTEALQQAGASRVTAPALEALRILEGTPRYNTDIRDRELPQETAQHRALHFSKGCYLGQEIVERIRSRGQVHRTFTGFRLDGALPPAGTMLEADGKQIGELTSAAAIPLPTGPIQLALGYVRREALERNLVLTYPGGTAAPVSTPFTVPAAG
ncbi:MAG: folate-binding protein YgfZ [Acidobacteriaceae bacterium]|nr:folate-binding protein YgfZ [Acidobacteriaceae bacterium]